MISPPPISTPYPHTTLFRPPAVTEPPDQAERAARLLYERLLERLQQPDRGELRGDGRLLEDLRDERDQAAEHGGGRGERADRKSTRLNSSHANISSAVFCLK